MPKFFFQNNIYSDDTKKEVSKKIENLKFNLPNEYIYFLQENNGGRIVGKSPYEKAKLVLKEYDSNLTFGSFLRIDNLQGADLPSDLQTENLIETLGHLLNSTEFYTFGAELGGVNTCYLINLESGKSYGEVRYMAYDGDVQMSNLGYYIAPSFTSFLKLLIDQNNGYIENLSEIYDELVVKGFK